VEILKFEMDVFFMLPYLTISRTSIDLSGQGKVLEFLNWSGKKDFWEKFLPFCIIVVIINIYTHLYLINRQNKHNIY